MNKKCLAGFLQGKNRRTLPTKSSIPISIVASSIGNHVKRNLAHLLTRQRTWIKTRGMINIRHVRRAQRGAFAGASPCSSDTSESREARQCPVCTAVFLVRARLDPTWNFGLRACGGCVWEGGTTNHAKQYKTRQCTRLNASSQSRFLKRISHTLPRWSRTRNTATTFAVIATVIITIAAAATTTTTTTTRSSLWWFSSARGLTRRLRLRDLDALRRGWRRVWMFDSGRLFALLFSLNCLRHTKYFQREGRGKGRERGKGEDLSVGNVEFPTC